MPDPDHAAPVTWRADGTPISPRYGDVYRSPGTDGRGGLAQARQVFLRGCGLLAEAGQPAAWHGAPHWAVLETGFGLGLNFLATWHAWLNDPQRPQRLHYSAIEAHPVSAADILRSAAPFAELRPLAKELATQWHSLLPGLHRIALSSERVQLLLSIGPVQSALAELSGAHHSLFLDGFNPRLNPDMWSPATLHAASALCRPDARAATWCVAAAVRQRLADCGFAAQRVPGLPPKRHALRARRQLDPHTPATAINAPVTPGRCAIVGAGLAGAAVAWSLAQRGWQVDVYDTAPQPASAASALPAGVLAPHVSPDDAPLSRLSRAGVRATLQRAALLLRPGHDFAPSGVLEHHPPGRRRRPPAWSQSEHPPSLGPEHPHTQTQAHTTGLPPQAPVLWHTHAGWLRPAALVQAQLQAPGIRWHGNCHISHISHIQAQAAHDSQPSHWQLQPKNPDSAPIQADLVVLCAGFDTLALIDTTPKNHLPLHALRGQIAFGPMPAQTTALPPFPINGQGSLIAHLPQPDGPQWVTGSTFVRASTNTRPSASEHAQNRLRLHTLLPQAAAALDTQWDTGQAQAWAGVRATLPDHLPAVGPWPHSEPQATGLHPLQLCTGLGARGLSLSVLCGELLAARLHHEPLPLPPAQAQRLAAERWLARIDHGGQFGLAPSSPGRAG